MPADSSSEVTLEIGHVLFIDIVGYSRLLTHEQTAQLEKLRKVVRETDQFRASEAEGKLLRLPTGDGGALVFRSSPEAPVKCALEISRALKNYPELRVRMGIHSGPVQDVTDLNEQANIAGAGINMAQRVMDCGDGGHILLSKHVAEDLEHDERWRPLLHELGSCKLKHGVSLNIVNLYADDVGNPQLPQKVRAARRDRARKWWATAIALGVALLAVAMAILRNRAQPNAVIPAKSIAVLPFENLTHEADSAYFADGIQDEILTRLAKIADLKVISRTSTLKYKSRPGNLSEIARQLGVANILEGSVQKSGDHVRINVQLIKADTDSHLWADTYDRKLIDIFAVETEVAKSIAETLRAQLTGPEQLAVSSHPTRDPEAHQLYLKGRFFWNKRNAVDLRRAIEFFSAAIAKDPNYALAYAALAQTWLLMPGYGGDAPRNCFPQAEAAARKALELDNRSPEAYAALGAVKLLYEFDLAGANLDYARALQLNPNDATAHQWFGSSALPAVGHHDHAISELKRALELDPLSLVVNVSLGAAYIQARRFDEAVAQLRKTLEMDAGFYYTHWNLGLALELKGLATEAIGLYEKATSLSTDAYPLALLGHLYGVIGRQDEARTILARLGETRTQRYIPAYCLAIVHLGLGDNSEAIHWLEEGYQERDGYRLALIRSDPLLDPLRGDPRFEKLANQIMPRSEN